MLIVEGPDCVGKTTLCKAFLKMLPTHIYSHFTRLPDLFDFYWGYVERMSRCIVQDRFHLSEIVYSRVRGDTPKVPPEWYRILDGKLRTLGAYTVVINADPELVRSRFDSTTQMYTLDQTLRCVELFKQVSRDRSDKEKIAGYEIDIDYVFNCTKETPYVTDTAIGQIIGGYCYRQVVVNELACRKPIAL